MKQRLLLLCGLILSGVVTHAQLEISFDSRIELPADGSSAEIVEYDATTNQLFITNAEIASIDIVDVSDWSVPTFEQSFNTEDLGEVNSIVNLGNGHVALAIEADSAQLPGQVAILRISDLTVVNTVTVGALPDMITVTPNGQTILVACEGEPSDNGVSNPVGAVAIIDISGGVEDLDQSDVNLVTFEDAPENIPGGIKWGTGNTTMGQDLEPEYIAVSMSGTVALVACQEANVLAVVGIPSGTIFTYVGLGFKDYSLPQNAFDPSNRDDTTLLRNYNVLGAYQPDALLGYSVDGQQYFISANEGDAVDYDFFSSEVRVDDLDLDTTVYPNADALQDDAELGRLKTFTPNTLGDADGDGLTEQIYCYGGRSFSIWDRQGQLLWDSENEFARIILDSFPAYFNYNGGDIEDQDARSDDKGIEPEGLAIGQVGDQLLAFIGLERQDAVMVYDISAGDEASFVTVLQQYTPEGSDDVAPEGLIYVPIDENNGKLVVANEVSGSVVIYDVASMPSSLDNAPTARLVASVYPTVTQGVVHVELDEQVGEVDFVITNGSGQVMSTGHVEGADTITIADFAAGTYQLLLYDSENRSMRVFKLMKQ